VKTPANKYKEAESSAADFQAEIDTCE